VGFDHHHGADEQGLLDRAREMYYLELLVLVLTA